MIRENKVGIYAVLTGDIVESAKLDPINLKIVIQSIKEGQVKFDRAYPGAMIGRADIFSGDSWQVLMRHEHLSFRAVLYFRALVKAVKSLNVDTRIALAWGQIDESTVNPERISESTGEAFTLSGRALAEMGKSKYLSMDIAENADQELQWGFKVLQPTMLLLDEISGRWTEIQARLIMFSLLGIKQNQIASEFSITPPTVNKSLNAAGWKRIKEFLESTETSLKRLII